MQTNPERDKVAKIGVNNNLVELKAKTIRIDLKDYSTNGGSLSTGFGGQYISYPLSGLKTAGFLTDFTNLLTADIYWYSSSWRSRYPDGRIILDGDGSTICVLLGTNYVNDGASIQIDLMCLGY